MKRDEPSPVDERSDPPRAQPDPPQSRPRRPGSARGEILDIASDFDAQSEGFEPTAWGAPSSALAEGVLGPQHPKDAPFVARARRHQSRFRAVELGLERHGEKGSRLHPDDARAGRNFCDFPGLIELVHRRYPPKSDPTALYTDLLRSEHAPFNLFGPAALRPALGRRLLAELFERPVAAVERVEIEWAPSPARDHLDDRTSFDAFIEYRLEGGALGFAGVEVKLSEGPYGWGQTERARMFNADSPYQRVHRAAGIYPDHALDALRTRSLKQIWRNQLLAESLFARGEYAEYVALLVGPSDNPHVDEVARRHAGLLSFGARDRFRFVSLRRLAAAAERVARDDEERAWARYLRRRYLM